MLLFLCYCVIVQNFAKNNIIFRGNYQYLKHLEVCICRNYEKYKIINKLVYLQLQDAYKKCWKTLETPNM